MTAGGKPAVKPGYRTTEAWATGAVIAGSVVASIAGNLPDKYAAMASAVAAGLYAVGRGLAKGGGSGGAG